jgi:hypothetical protein
MSGDRAAEALDPLCDRVKSTVGALPRTSAAWTGSSVAAASARIPPKSAVTPAKVLQSSGIPSMMSETYQAPV